MKNIIIYSESKTSTLEKPLASIDEVTIITKELSELKDLATQEAYVVVLDCSKEATKDALMRNKFNVPLLICSDEVFAGVTVRAEAFDYILTPVKEDELVVRINNLIKIKDLKEKINIVSTTDELTGLSNRTFLHQRLEEELSRAKRYKHSVSCLLLDLDFFKVINDMYGYDCGDVLLQKIADILREHVRKEDILTRYGDEEFIIVLPNTDEDNAYLFSERVRRDIEKMEFIPEGEEEAHPITISGGISSYPYLDDVDETAQTLIRYAEHALYNAKKRGKNKVVQFSQINFDF